MIDVVWLSVRSGTPARGYWDQHLLEQLLKDFNHHETVEGLTGAIVVIPGAYQGELIEQINYALSRLEWCLVIITSDEENKFPIAKLRHPNMKVWATYPHDAPVDLWLPIGPTPDFPVGGDVPQKTLDYVFAGQANHASRQKMVEWLEHSDLEGKLFVSDGFAKGLTPDEYGQLMRAAKVVPSPCGNISPDSFRAYEALEAGAVPVVEGGADFWAKLGLSLPHVGESWVKSVTELAKEYPEINNQVFATWQRYKISLRWWLTGTLLSLGVTLPEPSDIAVLIPTSPTPMHPDTSHIEQTIKDVRVHFPNELIVLMIDGVRPEQSHLKDPYGEYVRRLLWLTNQDGNILPLVFESHYHQAAMAQMAMPYVATPYIVFVEHDAPLTPDREIPWQEMAEVIKSGQADLIRFHFEAQIPKEHEPLMIGKPQNVDGVRLQKTRQWSQRPHIASANYYRRILYTHFTPDSRTMIEEVMHGVCQDEEWEKNKLWIYHPEGDIKRSYHLDSRATEPKFEELFIK